MSQSQDIKPYLSNLSAGKNSPLYTTYAAAMERSEFTLDRGYHLVFYDSTRGADFVTDKAGDWGLAFHKGSGSVHRLSEMFREPVITTSYSDIVKYFYFPFENIRVDVTFLVYSSRIAIQEITVANLGSRNAELEVVSFLAHKKGSFLDIQFHADDYAIAFSHRESPDGWVREQSIPYVDPVHNLFVFSREVPASRLRVEADARQSPVPHKEAKTISVAKNLELSPGQVAHLRVARVVHRPEENPRKLLAATQALMKENLDHYVAEAEKLYRNVPVLPFGDAEKEMMYWCAFTLMRQVMLPPEGKCGYNYYVFSREPQWGWGHGGQVFHESLSMLAYAYMDAASAMNSQRVYRERQHEDGYINYRTGSYLDETIPHNNQLTTSAPWYAWENWEIYKIAKDTNFLREMYPSSKSFYNYWVKNRDSDGDGLCEWGAHAVLECVRDGEVAVWDQVGWPSNFEALDLNCMLVQEAKALGAMASELGLEDEATVWRMEETKRIRKINETMWDEETGFYYHVDKRTHTFTHKAKNDLKREEIIGFLPLWAGVADVRRAKKLVEKLTDSKKFWRTYGVPSLAADDPGYNPKGYWNGPVWVEWDYLIERGLVEFGYADEARQLVDKVAAAMIAQLKKDHNFWEFYSPDEQWAGYHKTYIWAGLIARMMMDIADH
jgi:hypothetical protein